MKKTTALLIVVSLAVTGAVFAGQKPCSEDTENCLNKMVAKLKTKPWLGIETEKLESGWYRVSAVVADSPAAAAGFAEGDILVALNGVAIKADNKKQLKEAKLGLTVGGVANYVVKRQGTKQQLAVTLGNVPETKMAEWIGQHLMKHHAAEQIAATY